MEPRTVRPLGVFERAQYLTGEAFAYNLVVCVRLGGAFSESGLAAALESVQRRHPLLACAVRRRGGRPVFELDRTRPPIPVRGVERLGDDTWRGEVEAELVLPFEAGRAPLVRCTHVFGARGGARRELLFTFHHLLVDGVAVLTFLRGVLAAAGRSVESGEPASSAFAIPPSVEERLPADQRGLRAAWSSGRFLARQVADEIAYRWRTRALRTTPPEGPFGCRILPLAFGREETAELVRATRRQRVSPWSALNAAMLLAVVRHRYRGASAPYRFFAFPLLRPYLRPPVADGVVASYTSVLRLTVPVRENTGLWALAASIHRLSDRAAKRGEKFLAARWSALSMKTMLNQRARRMGTAALSYAGAVELAPEDVPFAVEGLHAFVSNFPPGPEFTAQARLFRRRLWLDIVYLDSDMDKTEATAIAGEMRGLLAAAVAGKEKEL